MFVELGEQQFYHLVNSEHSTFTVQIKQWRFKVDLGEVFDSKVLMSFRLLAVSPPPLYLHSGEI